MTEFSLNSIPGVTVVRLSEAHIDGIIELMNKEGWYYYDHHELTRYLNLDQECFVLLKNDCILGSIFTTNYGNQAWIGNIVVAKDARGQGLAADLLRTVIDYLKESRQIPTFRLGAVPLAIGLYKRKGFHAESFTTAQEAELPLEAECNEIRLNKNVKVEKLHAQDLVVIADIDAQYFKSNRLELLTEIYNDSMSCVCLKDKGTIVGFLMIRRRQTSKDEGGFAEGPDHAYRLGPSCVLPAYGINGFKALFREAIGPVNEEVAQLGGTARMYVVFPKNANKDEIYEETRELAEAMDTDTDMDLDRTFDEHDHIFGAPASAKNDAQWTFMESLGFHQEYFEQIMSYTPGEPENTHPAQRKATATQAVPEGIFASATPGDKA